MNISLLRRSFLVLVASSAQLASAGVMTPYSIQNVPTNSVKLPWSVAGVIQPENLHCFKVSAPTNEELRDEILRSDVEGKIGTEIAGVYYKSEDARLLQDFSNLLKDRSGVIPTWVRNQFSSPTTQPLDIIDATQRIFGEREGLQLLYLFKRYRVNASHIQALDTAPWLPEELDTLILGLSDLPDHLVPFPLHRYSRERGYQPAFRNRRGEKKGGRSTGYVVANSAMTYFDTWSELPTEMAKRDTVLHEVSHNLQYLITDKQNWTNLSPWPAVIKYSAMIGSEVSDQYEKTRTSYDGLYEEPFVSRYAKASPGEDFAESVTAYRYAPQWLLARNPQKYTYLKEVIFDGIEYLSEDTCREKNTSDRTKYESAITRAFSEFQLKLMDTKTLTLTDQATRSEMIKCNANFVTTLSEKLHNDCISQAVVKWFAREYKSDLLNFSADTVDVRAADATGGISLPKMDYYLGRRVGEGARSSIRKNFIQDFISFKTQNGTAAPNCNQFAVLFTNWITAGEKSSSLFKSGIHDPSKPQLTAEFLQQVCEKGIATRPNYITLFERFKGRGPLTAAEFRTGIQELMHH